MKYSLRVFDAAGLVQTISLEGDTSDGAASIARSRGLRVISIRADGVARRRLAQSTALGGARFNVELFARELAALIDAGVSVIDALRTLGSNERREASAQVYRDLLRRLEEGHSLSAALNFADDVFPPVLVACVKASEQTGGLAESLKRYSRNSATLQALRARVISASVYPAVLLAVGSVVVLFLLAFVVPRFAGLLEHSGHELPLLSQWLMAWGSLVHAHGAELAAALAIVVLGSLVALRRASVRNWAADRVLALPGIGEYFRIYRQAQFFRTAAMLVDGGIPVVQAFDLAQALVSRADRAALVLALERVRNGGRISEAFLDCGLASPITFRLLTVAEKTGGLGPVLDKVASFQEAHVSRAIDLISRLIEPAMMIVIGVVIGGIVVLMYMPIFQLASSIE
ncbi:general secretion pathway protein F [Trinickia symbiotica]|uniref:Type II secretion system F family protein n=1 Tax=Trinickia symbiotica TaxID=863227 RepID=A0A2N7X1J2_9BURK|nr:type II secretion system F family protein [Trinickia symbiotica]PMS35606.1 type II secretion system F family protein [Trinickia symbiotica]PPK47670.1 general secretion pathway protein F [Trinickia symbiotica]